jgi:hypothetical protein
MKLIDKLNQLDACSGRIEYVADQSAYDAWHNCKRGDWMLWIAEEQNIDFRVLVKASIECFKLVEHLLVDRTCINALRAAKRYSEGICEHHDLICACSNASRVICGNVDYSAAFHASFSSVYLSGVKANISAVHVAKSTAYDIPYDYKYAAEMNTLKECADICRKIIPFESLGL